jgi:hypothetical protein
LALVLAFGCGKKAAPIYDARLPDAASPDAGVDAMPDAPGIDAALGHPGTGTVTGAVQATSPNYRLYGTLRSGDGSSTSPNYQRHGGITGATQR